VITTFFLSARRFAFSKYIYLLCDFFWIPKFYYAFKYEVMSAYIEKYTSRKTKMT
jgi:hypothetical protein